MNSCPRSLPQGCASSSTSRYRQWQVRGMGVGWGGYALSLTLAPPSRSALCSTMQGPCSSTPYWTPYLVSWSWWGGELWARPWGWNGGEERLGGQLSGSTSEWAPSMWCCGTALGSIWPLLPTCCVTLVSTHFPLDLGVLLGTCPGSCEDNCRTVVKVLNTCLLIIGGPFVFITWHLRGV